MRKLVLPIVTITLALSGVSALAQVSSSDDDRFKPRVYGSLSVNGGNVAVVHAQHAPVQQGTAISNEQQSVIDEARRVQTYQSYTRGDVQYSHSDTPVPTTATSIVDTTVIHNVVKGDTLYNISKRYNISIQDIQEANGIQGSAIALGQSLILPTQVKVSSTYLSPTQPVISNTPYANGSVMRVVQPVGVQTSSIYAVLPKDTLYGIARRTCTSVDDIVSTNGIGDKDNLKPGQKLLLPQGHCLTR
ncbi:lytic transglycosylase [Litorimonas taeanensis]|nr:LysM peptidoglycan-binding domain-containing protein [Litorimonas taeanensis]